MTDDRAQRAPTVLQPSARCQGASVPTVPPPTEEARTVGHGHTLQRERSSVPPSRGAADVKTHPASECSAGLALADCCDCGERSYRRPDPALGVPVRCSACEEREVARLRRLAGRRGGLDLEGLVAFERLKRPARGEER